MYVMAGVYGVVFGASPAGWSRRSPAPRDVLPGRTDCHRAVGHGHDRGPLLPGRLAYGRTVGILAAGFLTADLLHIRDSHCITTDVPLTFLLALAIFLALRYWQHRAAKRRRCSGLFAGLAASMKYPGGLALLALLLAHAGRQPGRPPGAASSAGTRLVAAGLALVGFLPGTPFALITPVAFVRGVLTSCARSTRCSSATRRDMPGYLFHLAYSLPEGMGWPVRPGARRTRVGGGRPGWREAILLAFPLPYFLVIGTWSSRFERYVLPLLPFLTILAALAAGRGARAGSTERGGPRRAMARPSWLRSRPPLLVAPALGRMTASTGSSPRPDTRQLGSGGSSAGAPGGADRDGALLPALPVSRRPAPRGDREPRRPAAARRPPARPRTAGAPGQATGCSASTPTTSTLVGRPRGVRRAVRLHLPAPPPGVRPSSTPAASTPELEPGRSWSSRLDRAGGRRCGSGTSIRR